jgi:hypothetical protein
MKSSCLPFRPFLTHLLSLSLSLSLSFIRWASKSACLSSSFPLLCVCLTAPPLHPLRLFGLHSPMDKCWEKEARIPVFPLDCRLPRRGGFSTESFGIPSWAHLRVSLVTVISPTKGKIRLSFSPLPFVSPYFTILSLFTDILSVCSKRGRQLISWHCLQLLLSVIYLE